VVEVLLENTRRVQEEVPPGPFEIESLPVVTGAGELQLRVTDLLGREQLITQSYYVSPRLLRAGLSDYSYELGFERESFNEDSFDYGDPLLVGTHRHGLTDALTLEGRGEASAGRQALGAGSFLLLGNYGLLSAGVVGSRDGDDGLGAAGLLEYEYRANRFSVGLRTRLAGDDFRQLGLDDEERARRVDQLSFGLGLYPYGRLGLLLVNAEGRGDFEDQQSVSASYSLPLGFASVLFSALRTIEPERDLALVANLSIPLAPSRSLTASAQYRGDDRRGRLEYRRSRGSSDLGPSYRLATELGDDPQRLDGTLRYDAALASGQLDLEYGDGEAAVRGNLEGSLALIDGKVMASRRLGPAFGMVALPGYPDITVYLENREAGRTDDEGYLLLPRLNPYQENRVRIRSEDLPLTAEIASDERIAVPYARSGVQVGFEVKQHRTALATLLDARGDPLPAGLQLASEDGRASAQVADRGLAYVKADAEGPFGLASVPGQPAFRCELPPLPDEPMAALGEIRCQ
jgi:outer membrane usher protein